MCLRNICNKQTTLWLTWGFPFFVCVYAASVRHRYSISVISKDAVQSTIDLSLIAKLKTSVDIHTVFKLHINLNVSKTNV